MSTVEFGSLFEFIRNGLNIKQDKSGNGLPISRIETIWNSSINPERVGYAGLTEDDCDGWLLSSGDILFSHINSVEHIGKCAVFEGAPAKLVHGMNLLCLRCKADSLLPAYAKHLIRSEGFRARLSNYINKAVNQASVSIGNLKGIEVTVPTLPEQRRIANILDKADALRQKRREALALLDALAQSVFVEMFGDPVTNPKGINKQTLASVAEIATGSTPNRSNDDFYEGAIPWIKTTEVVGEEIFDTEEKLTEEGLKAIRGKLHPENSIVVAMYGQGQTRGRCGLLRLQASCNQACGVIRPSDFFDSLFMFQQLQMAYERLRALGRGGNQENLNLQLLGRFEVLVPPKDMQAIFVERIKAINCMKASHLDALTKQDALFMSLHHRAFRGEL